MFPVCLGVCMCVKWKELSHVLCILLRKQYLEGVFLFLSPPGVNLPYVPVFQSDSRLHRRALSTSSFQTVDWWEGRKYRQGDNLCVFMRHLAQCFWSFNSLLSLPPYIYTYSHLSLFSPTFSPGTHLLLSAHLYLFKCAKHNRWCSTIVQKLKSSGPLCFLLGHPPIYFSLYGAGGFHFLHCVMVSEWRKDKGRGHSSKRVGQDRRVQHSKQTANDRNRSVGEEPPPHT